MASQDEVHIQGPPPPARRDDVVVEELDGEALVYDPESGAVHRFNAVVMFVWSCCDGHRPVDQIAKTMSKMYDISDVESEEQVDRIITDFERLGLLDEGLQSEADPAEEGDSEGTRMECGDAVEDVGPGAMTRRGLIRGGVGVLVFAPPVISTFFARGAHAAYSPNPINNNFSPLGAGACKNPGYSCAVKGDCCGGASNNNCEGGVCCVKKNKTTCVQDSDCCAGLTCNAGTCEQ